MREEPGYQRHEGVCRECGQPVVYYNSVKRYPDHVVCEKHRPRVIERRVS